ncbi:hypothetical protein H9L39_10285 [Fusarium oxysporum f. sp. albedinis]|nr:hypothetical protein H9L39_10285 [Fusarium oxysporum f. sp. albedinis]
MDLVERLNLNSWPQNLPGWSVLMLNASVLHPTTTGGGLVPPCISPSEACLAMFNPPEKNPPQPIMSYS